MSDPSTTLSRRAKARLGETTSPGDPRCIWTPDAFVLLAVLVLAALTVSADPALAADPFSWANQKLSGAKSTALTFLNTLGFFALIGCVAVGMLKKQGWPFAWAGAIFGGLLLANGYAYFSDWFTT